VYVAELRLGDLVKTEWAKAEGLKAATGRNVQIEGVQVVASWVKHFAANNQETGRGSINVERDERILREIYRGLPVRLLVTSGSGAA